MSRAPTALLLALLLPCAQAAPIELTFQKSGAVATGQAQVFDAWPDGCAPQVDQVAVDEHQIVLRAVLPDADCRRRAARKELRESRLHFAIPPLWAGIYRVRYEVRVAGAAESELHGFRLVDLSPRNTPAPRPESGLWWPEQGGDFGHAGPGLGLLMETQSDTLSLTVLGYGKNGEAQWFYGASPLDAHLLEMDLAQLSEGAGPFDPYRAPKRLAPAGSVQIELLSPARANLWFVRPIGDSRALSVEPVSMVRFSFAQTTPQAWIGRWVIAAERGDTPASRHIDFVAVEPTPTGFALVDARQEYRLSCVSAPTRPNSPPIYCDLVAPGATREVRFDRTALYELRGRTMSGEAVAALKLGR